MSTRTLALTLALAFPCAEALGQVDTAGSAPDDGSPPLKHMISFSPLFAVLGFYTGEIERAVAHGLSAAVGGSAFSLGPFAYRSLDLKLRYYGEGTALRGFAVGVTAGVVGLGAGEGGAFAKGISARGFAVGTETSFTRYRGRNRNIAMTFGGGVKRLLRFAGRDVSGARLTLPTARASVGIAF